MLGREEALPEDWFPEEASWSNYGRHRNAIERAIGALVHEMVNGLDLKTLGFDQDRSIEYLVGHVRDELTWVVSTLVTRKIIAAEFGLDPDRPRWEPSAETPPSVSGK